MTAARIPASPTMSEDELLQGLCDALAAGGRGRRWKSVEETANRLDRLPQDVR